MEIIYKTYHLTNEDNMNRLKHDAFDNRLSLYKSYLMGTEYPNIAIINICYSLRNNKRLVINHLQPYNLVQQNTNFINLG